VLSPRSAVPLIQDRACCRFSAQGRLPARPGSRLRLYGSGEDLSSRGFRFQVLGPWAQCPQPVASVFALKAGGPGPWLHQQLGDDVRPGRWWLAGRPIRQQRLQPVAGNKLPVARTGRHGLTCPVPSDQQHPGARGDQLLQPEPLLRLPLSQQGSRPSRRLLQPGRAPFWGVLRAEDSRPLDPLGGQVGSDQDTLAHGPRSMAGQALRARGSGSWSPGLGLNRTSPLLSPPTTAQLQEDRIGGSRHSRATLPSLTLLTAVRR